jgi:hypothetical protein
VIPRIAAMDEADRDLSAHALVAMAVGPGLRSPLMWSAST